MNKLMSYATDVKTVLFFQFSSVKFSVYVFQRCSDGSELQNSQ